MPGIKRLENYKPIGDRRCGRCALIKPVSEFPRRQSGKYAGALLHCCITCNLERAREWNKAHPGATAKRNHAKGKCLPYAENTLCHMWSGVYVAEQIASKCFPDYARLPIGNPGYDLVNALGTTIDCKSSRLRKISRTSMGWQFVIDRNTTPDYFFCIAFGEEKSTTPLVMWLIPSKVISHLKRLTINRGEKSRQRWHKYEF